MKRHKARSNKQKKKLIPSRPPDERLDKLLYRYQAFHNYLFIFWILIAILFIYFVSVDFASWDNLVKAVPKYIWISSWVAGFITLLIRLRLTAIREANMPRILSDYQYFKKYSRLQVSFTVLGFSFFSAPFVIGSGLVTPLTNFIVKHVPSIPKPVINTILQAAGSVFLGVIGNLVTELLKMLYRSRLLRCTKKPSVG